MSSVWQFAQHIADVGKSHVDDLTEIVKGGYGGGGSTWAHWHLALAYARYLDHDFHIWCNEVVRREMEGPSTNNTALLARLDRMEAVMLHLVESSAEKLPSRSGTLREYPVDRRAMQTLISRTARGLGWKFGAIQARLASQLGVASYLYLSVHRIDEARQVLGDMLYRTAQQEAERSEKEKERRFGEGVFQALGKDLN